MTSSALRAGALGCALLATTCLTAPAMAVVFPEQQRQAPDANGVDVISGRVSVPVRSVSVGTADSGLTYVNGWADGRFFDTFSVQVSGFGTTAMAIIIYGDSKRFSDNGDGTYTNLDGDGATFVETATTYVYTARDGTVFTFLKSLADTGWAASVKARISTIQRPNGEILTYHHILEAGFQHCDFQFNCVFVPPGGRVQSVTSNLGFQLKATYASNTWNEDGSSNDEWNRLSRVQAINNAVDYCDPDANSCSGLTQTWPELTLDESTSGSSTTHDFIDLGSNITSVVTGGNGVTSVTSPADPSQDLSVTYDANGRVGTFARGGGSWGYTYADATVNGVNQRTTTVTQPLGGSRVYVSNLDLHRVISVTDELGHITSYQYDTMGRLTRVTQPEGNYIELTLDARGNVTLARRRDKNNASANDIVTSAVYPTTCTNAVTCNRPTSVTDARSHTTDFTYDATHGGVLTATAPLPTASATVRPQVRYTYAPRSAWYKNSSGVIVQAPSAVYGLTAVSTCQTGASPTCVGTADEVKTTIDYGTGSSSSANNLFTRSVSSGAGNGSLTATTAIAYDAVGNVTSVDGPLAGTADTSGFRYDNLRRLTTSVSPDPDGAGSLPHRARRITYNGDGNVTRIEAGTTTTLTGTFTTATTGERVEYTYDTLGRRTTETLISGTLISPTRHALTQTSYDTRGRVQCIAQRMNPSEFTSLPPSACTLDTTSTTYGDDRITRTTYTNADQVSLVQTGYGVAGVVADEVAATYTDNGRVNYVTDANGNRTTYEYDSQDRLVKTRYPSPTTDGVSSATDYEQLTLDANGNVTNLRLRDTTSIAFTYDNLDRMTFKNLADADPDVTYGYDLLGRMTSATSSIQSLTFTYDALGRNLTQTGLFGSATSTWDLAGRRTRLTYPGTGLFIDYDYLVTGEVTKIRENGATSGVGVLATYAYDIFGRRDLLTRGNGTTTDYTYDSVSRLSQLVQDFPVATSDLTLGFSYNPASQITSNTRSNNSYSWTDHYAVNRPYQANGLNQYTQSGTVVPTYDNRGNLTSAGGSTYTYNSENMLIAATGAALSYDALMRLYRTSNGTVSTRRAYDGEALIAEFDGSGALVRRFVHGPGVDEPLVWYEGSGTGDRRWLHADERGSVIAISDGTGTATNINAYDEYGIPESTNDGRFQYTGQQWIAELGMYHYRARIYSPTLGRFLQTDPIGYVANMNSYAYVSNDPINFIDPTGLKNWCASSPDDGGEVCYTSDIMYFLMQQLFGNRNVFLTHDPFGDIRFDPRRAIERAVGKSACAALEVLLPKNGRVRLGIDAGLGVGLAGTVGFGGSLHRDGSVNLDFYYGRGGGIGATAQGGITVGNDASPPGHLSTPMDTIVSAGPVTVGNNGSSVLIEGASAGYLWATTRKDTYTNQVQAPRCPGQ